jgi:tritrans,polycis-undecaprenyl-diphosphate synthase [geranylgeranyl-diphosphate specific]
MAKDIAQMIADTAYLAYEKRLLNEVMQGTIPKHVAIIMDGNRRFARELGLSPPEGHVRGRDTLEQVLEWCLDLNIRVLTVYAFSTENLERPREEVDELMRLFEENFRRAGDDERVHEHGIRIRAIGQLELLPKSVQEAIKYAESRTAGYDNYYYNLAVAYGGRQEILKAIKDVASKVRDGELSVDDITADVFSNHLYTADLPDPDLVLRTSGEERISNFLIWQLAYSELYFVDVYWPGFRKIDFLRAVRSYQMRRRRFGQ